MNKLTINLPNQTQVNVEFDSVTDAVAFTRAMSEVVEKTTKSEAKTSPVVSHQKGKHRKHSRWTLAEFQRIKNLLHLSNNEVVCDRELRLNHTCGAIQAVLSLIRGRHVSPKNGKLLNDFISSMNSFTQDGT